MSPALLGFVIFGTMVMFALGIIWLVPPKDH